MKFDGAVVISGGFDPIHIGHLRMIQDAAKLGIKLIVIANGDRFLMDKKAMPSCQLRNDWKSSKVLRELIEPLSQLMKT